MTSPDTSWRNAECEGMLAVQFVVGDAGFLFPETSKGGKGGGKIPSSPDHIRPQQFLDIKPNGC